MNRTTLAIVGALALIAGLVAFMLLRDPAAPVEKARVDTAQTKKAMPDEKSAAEVLLERAPEQPVLATRRDRTAKPAAAPAAEPPPAAAPTTGVLHIESDVPGAQVFIDRAFVGTAPLKAENIKPGAHMLNAAAEGYDGIAEIIEVTPGERTVTVKFREVRLDAAIDVIHKHRMGSCKGRLIATPHGMRYETTNKEDAFVVALTDLDVFQVDYMEKNLKVKPRAGRQYNFTDPQEGNADRLFVFHRDVDKARVRLKKGDTPAAR